MGNQWIKIYKITSESKKYKCQLNLYKRISYNQSTSKSSRKSITNQKAVNIFNARFQAA